MRVIFPSEDILPVPDKIGTVPALKAFIEEETGIPSAAQRLFTGRGELNDTQSLSAFPRNVDIDLVIAAGPSYRICRTAIRDRLDSVSGEIFVTHASERAARDAAALGSYPQLNLTPAKFEPVPQEGQSKLFFDAYAEGRDARQAQLGRTRGQLEDGPVVISTFNWAYRAMVANWVASCDKNNIDCRSFTLLFPTDERADAFAKDLGLRTYFDGESYGEQPMEGSKAFGDRRFARIMFAKIAMTLDMLDVGGEIIRQDVDIVWHRDPRSDLVRHAEQNGLDMLFMYDGPNRLHQPLHYNSGFVFIRDNPFSHHTWKTVFQNYGWVLAEGGEQRLINRVVNLLQPRGLRTARLPEEIYVNGHVISRAMKGGENMPQGSAVVHASWTLNIDAKIEHMKQLGLWYL